MKTNIPYCQQCKGIEDPTEHSSHLNKNSKRKDKEGNIVYAYLCRKCNKERCRNYRHTPAGKAKFKEIMEKSTKKNIVKQYARIKMNWHLRAGNIIKPKECTHCGEIKTLEGHHFDYTKPLEVVWVCRDCHVDYFD